MTKCNTRRKNVFLLFIGMLLIIVGVYLIINIFWISDSLIMNLMAVTPTSVAKEKWMKTEKPVSHYVYFFNWTNPEDIYNSSIKPKFEQVGPYTFKEYREKINVKFHKNDTVSYSLVSRYYEDGENSKNLSDVITTLNFIAYSAAHTYRYSSIVKKNFISMFLSITSNFYVRKTAKELLFEGFRDPILDGYGFISPFITSEQVPDKFGWMYGTNGSSGGSLLNMGISKDENYGRVYEWNNNKKNPYFEGKCAEFRGTTSELFPMNRDKGPQYFFHKSVCRSFKLSYEKDEYVEGLKGYRYVIGRENFDNGTISPENSCSCNGECLPVGVMNVSSCLKNSPIYFSLPHFYQADPVYTSSVEGLNPEKNEHEFSMTLQPKLGIITKVNGRLQLNVYLQPDPHFSFYKNIPKVMFPIFWSQQNFTMKEDLASKLKILVYIPNVGFGFSIICICIGLTLGIFVLYKFLRERSRKNNVQIPEEQPLQSGKNLTYIRMCCK